MVATKALAMPQMEGQARGIAVRWRAAGFRRADRGVLLNLKGKTPQNTAPHSGDDGKTCVRATRAVRRHCM